MENLKFRALYKPTNEYADIDSIDFANKIVVLKSYPLVRSFGLDKVDFDEVIIEQFTGLKDKNGKEIYEGDIVEVPTIDEIGSVDLDTLIYQKIVYEETMFLCKEVNQTKMASEGGGGASLMCFFDDGLNEIKVIGNIHENPELLEVGK